MALAQFRSTVPYAVQDENIDDSWSTDAECMEVGLKLSAD